LYVADRRAAEVVDQQCSTVVLRSVVNYTTSLEMQGMSITLLKPDEEMIELWDAPVQTAALRWGR
jgi:dihydroxyacetone kinase-like protein